MLIRRIVLLGWVLAGTVAPARCDTYLAYPAPVPLPLPNSVATGPLVAIAPYDHAFIVRGYATPPQQPYYNVPSHAAVAPY